MLNDMYDRETDLAEVSDWLAHGFNVMLINRPLPAHVSFITIAL